MDCQTGKGPLLISGLLLPVWCVGARTRFLMTRCTIPTFVNVQVCRKYIYRILSKNSSPTVARKIRHLVTMSKMAEGDEYLDYHDETLERRDNWSKFGTVPDVPGQLAPMLLLYSMA